MSVFFKRRHTVPLIIDAFVSFSQEKVEGKKEHVFFCFSAKSLVVAFLCIGVEIAFYYLMLHGFLSILKV